MNQPNPLTSNTSHPAAAPLHRRRQWRVAVVGGSLTGPAAALLLLQAGVDNITVYEAMPAPHTLGGGLISLEHSSLDILHRIGVPQDEVVHLDSETIWQTPVYGRALGQPVRRAYPGRFTTWTLLHQALAARMPSGLLRVNARVTGLVEHDRRPLLQFTDGHSEPADLVVFADGRASAGRRLLDPARRLHYAGYVGHRGTVAVTTPAITDFWRLEPGPGMQFNIAPVPGGLDWTFYLNMAAADYTVALGAAPNRRLFVTGDQLSAAVRATTDGSAKQLPEAFSAIVHATTDRSVFPVMDIDEPTRMVWPIGDGYAVLLGDALAPVRAHTARGANNGLEQADGLAAVVRQHLRYRAELGGALTGWQRRHQAAAVAAVRLGPRIGARVGLGLPTPGSTGPAGRPALTGAR